MMTAAAIVFTLKSAAFKNGAEIPTRYTCEGANVSPPLAWAGVPKSAKTLALVVDDPDAPDPAAPKTTWVHWVIYNLPTGLTALPEDVHGSEEGGQLGFNDFRETKWGGPCPPVGKHHYHFKLYALDTKLDFTSAPTKAQLEKAMVGHVLAKAELIGLYQKKN